jgi:hypothetical protein
VLNQAGLNLFFDNHLLYVFQDPLAFCQRQTSRFQPQRAVSLKFSYGMHPLAAVLTDRDKLKPEPHCAPPFRFNSDNSQFNFWRSNFRSRKR